MQITDHLILRCLDNKILCTLGQCEPEMLSAADIMWPEGDTLANLDPSLRILCTLSELYDRELVAAIGWAKQIPGHFYHPSNSIGLLRISFSSFFYFLPRSNCLMSLDVN